VTAAVSLDAVFEDPLVDGVVLAIPTPAHAPLIRKAIEAGKDYLVEKPLCEHHEQAMALDAEIKAGGLIGIVGCIHRYVPPFMEAAKALERCAGNIEVRSSRACGRRATSDRRSRFKATLQAYEGRRRWRHQ
jgi:predicted dehydrogenase